MPSTRTLTLPLKTLIPATEDGEEGQVEDVCDIDCMVEFTSHKAHRGYRDSLGVPEEPDEPAGVDIESVKRLDTKQDVTDKEIEDYRVEELLMEALNKEDLY